MITQASIPFTDFVRDYFEIWIDRLLGGERLVYLGLLSLVLLLEALVMGFRRSSLCRILSFSASARNDIVCDILHFIGGHKIIALLTSAGIPLFISYFYNRFAGVTVLPQIRNPMLAYLLWFVCVDFLDYWYHRFSHEWSFRWQVHKYHHSATEFNVVTGNRIHFLDETFAELFKIMPLTLLGLPPTVYAAIRATKLVADFWQHSAIPWDYGWVGRWLLYSPVGHRIHHSYEEEHWDKNFGNILVIWDRMFKTWYDQGRVNEAIGLPDNPFNRGSVVQDWLLGYKLFWTEFRKGIKTGLWRVPQNTPRPLPTKK